MYRSAFCQQLVTCLMQVCDAGYAAPFVYPYPCGRLMRM